MTWLTINQAAKSKHGKPSASAIRRSVKEIAALDDHPVRHLVTPNPDKLKQCKEAGVDPVYEVDEELFHRLCIEKGFVDDESGDSTLDKALDMLKQELNDKRAIIEDLKQELSEEKKERKTANQMLMLVDPKKRRIIERQQKLLESQQIDADIPPQQQRWWSGLWCAITR